MCCCCFKNCLWLCWFVYASVLALLVIVLQSAQLGVTGGPYPTQITADGSIVLLFSNSCTLIFCIAAVIFLARDCKNIIAYIVILFFLIFVFACSLFIPYAISQQKELNVTDIQAYATQYSKDHNGAAPPFLEFVQGHDVPCCGGEGFHDYVFPFPEKVEDTFSVPDSCCVQKSKSSGCGKDLTYRDFNTSYWVHHRIQALSFDLIKEATSSSHFLDLIREAFKKEVEQKTNKTLNLMIEEKLIPNHPNDPIIVPNREKPYFPLVIIEHIQSFIRESINNTAQEFPNGTRSQVKVLETIKEGKKADLKTFAEKQKPKIKIYGCAIVLRLALKAKFVPTLAKQLIEFFIYGLLTLVCVQAVLNFVCIVIYNYYFWKIIKSEGGKGQQRPVLLIQSNVPFQGYGDGKIQSTFYGTGMSTTADTAAAATGAGNAPSSPPPMTASQVKEDDMPFSTDGMTAKEVENMKKLTVQLNQTN